MTSRPAADVCGKPITAVIPDLETRGLAAAFRRVLEQGSVELLAPALHKYLIPCPPQDPTSTFQHMQQRTVIAPLRDGPKITGLVVTIEDVTSRRQKEKDLANVDTLASDDWRKGPREALLALIESYTDVVFELDAAAVEGWRKSD